MFGVNFKITNFESYFCKLHFWQTLYGLYYKNYLFLKGLVCACIRWMHKQYMMYEYVATCDNWKKWIWTCKRLSKVLRKRDKENISPIIWASSDVEITIFSEHSGGAKCHFWFPKCFQTKLKPKCIIFCVWHFRI